MPADKSEACVKCDLPAWDAWDLNFCADGNEKRRRPLCKEHDIELNGYLLQFFQVPDAKQKLEVYRAKVLQEQC